MDRRTFLASVSVLPVALSLGGCGDDQFPDYRYRMTVYVGDKPFSSVRAVLQEQVSSVADSSGQAVKRSLKGEAVIIEANSRTYYELLGKHDEQEYGQQVVNYALITLVPEFRSEERRVGKECVIRVDFGGRLKH